MAQPQRLKRGAPVPYRLLAGVEPCGRRGWLVVSGKLQGVSLFPEPPQLLGTLIEILDYRPSFEIVALHAPIGLPSALHPGGRAPTVPPAACSAPAGARPSPRRRPARCSTTRPAPA